jgi:pimeloyl-ACP methyl ester carboxylesterase
MSMTMEGSPHRAHVNGIDVAYDLTGDGFPLIALHGFPRNRKVWGKITPRLSDRFTILAPDRRGYGDSDRPADPAGYDNATMARDTIALADHLGWDRFVVVGHDKGAPTAQRLATDLPNRVRGLVMLDATPAGVRTTGPRDPSGRSWYMDFFRQRGVAEQLIGQNPRLFFSLFLDRNPHLSREEHEYYLETFCRPGSVEAVLADYRSSLEDDAARWQEEHQRGVQIKVPVCALWGGRGPTANAPVLDRWREIAADVRGGPIADSAHYVQEEQPAAVAQQILRFADELGLE